jgi:hypothetical protein
MEKNIKNTKLTPKFFFISLGVIVTLITNVSSLLVLFFESLNKKFPDALNSIYQYGYNSYDFETIRVSMATLIIFLPVFIFISYLWVKESKEDSNHTNMILRKWMIYLILFLASLLIIIDLVTLVNYFVSGEITTRFIFKVLGTLIIGSLIDYYYFISMKTESLNFSKIKKLSLICGTIFVLFVVGLIVWSFSIIGSPVKQRAWRLDDRRVNDLQNIQYQIINYWQYKQKLPNNLSELSNPMSGYSLPVEPEFEKGRVYEYIPKNDLSFELCATFTAEMPKGWQEGNYVNVSGPIFREGEIKTDMEALYPAGSGLNESWSHDIGRTCFSRTIDKDMYPPIKEIK